MIKRNKVKEADFSFRVTFHFFSKKTRLPTLLLLYIHKVV